MHRRLGGCVVAVTPTGQESWLPHVHGFMEDCHFRKIVTISQYKREVTSFQHMRALIHMPRFKSVSHMLAMHPHVDMIRIGDFYHTVSVGGKANEICKQPVDDDINVLIKCGQQLLYGLHQVGYAFGNFYQATPLRVSKDLYVFRPSGCLHPVNHIIATRQFSESHFTSPVQVIHEMLSSELESAEIDTALFRQRFLSFWQYLLVQTCGDLQVIDITRSYFSTCKGCVDCIDYYMSKYVVFTDDSHKKILKDPHKSYGYFCDSDLFQLGISAHIRCENAGIAVDAKATDMIAKCLFGDYIDVCVLNTCDISTLPDHFNVRYADPPPEPEPPPPPPEPEPEPEPKPPPEPEPPLLPPPPPPEPEPKPPPLPPPPPEPEPDPEPEPEPEPEPKPEPPPLPPPSPEPEPEPEPPPLPPPPPELEPEPKPPPLPPPPPEPEPEPKPPPLSPPPPEPEPPPPTEPDHQPISQPEPQHIRSQVESTPKPQTQPPSLIPEPEHVLELTPESKPAPKSLVKKSTPIQQSSKAAEPPPRPVSKTICIDDQDVKVEIHSMGIVKKLRFLSVHSGERVVRSDPNGDYIIWKGMQVYV